jgi:formate hydrogenlyase subunit 3/multisubunit Na+/H+ antiporter MnhD subunit
MNIDASHYATTGFVTFLFGIFCAYWAQTTKRSGWLWFFLGFFFAPITGIFLLNKNASDLDPSRLTSA